MFNMQPYSGGANAEYQPDPRILDYQQKVEIDLYKEGQLSAIRLNEAWMKEDAIEKKRTDSYANRLKLREAAKERDRALVQALEVDEAGNILVCTRNTSIETQARRFTNMQQPSIFILRSLDNPMENPVYMLSCLVGKKQQYIFLSTDRLARGDYLIAKLTAAGICFLSKPSIIKPLMLQLIGELAEHCTGKKSVPETAGWTKTSNGYMFYSEEEVTWSKIKALSK